MMIRARHSLRVTSVLLVCSMLLFAMPYAHAQEISQQSPEPPLDALGESQMEADIQSMLSGPIVNESTGGDISPMATLSPTGGDYFIALFDYFKVLAPEPLMGTAALEDFDTENQYFDLQKWSFVGNSTDGYQIKSYTNPMCCLTADPISCEVSVTVLASGTGETYQRWKVSGGYLVLYAPNTLVNGLRLTLNISPYGVINSMTLTTTGTSFKLCDAGNYVMPTSISVAAHYAVYNEFVTLVITKTPANATVDSSMISLYTSTGNLDLYGGGVIRAKTTAGAYTVVITDRLTQCATTCTFKVDQKREGKFLLMNYDSRRLADVTTNAGAYVKQQELSADETQQFEFVYISRGSYAIRLVSSPGLYLSAENASLNAKVKLVSYNSATATNDYARWRIETTYLNGEMLYKIMPAYTTASRVLGCLSGDTAGSELKILSFASSTPCLLWVPAQIGAINDTPLVGQQMSNWCWAASSYMYLKHYEPTNPVTQLQIYEEAKLCLYYPEGEEYDLNTGGTVWDMEYAIEELAYDNDFGTLASYADWGYFSKAQVMQSMSNTTIPAIYIVGRGRYHAITPNVNSRTGHAVVMFGYVTISGKVYFLIHDPWHDNAVKNEDGTMSNNPGQTRMLTYEHLLKNTLCECRVEGSTGTYCNDYTNDISEIVLWDMAIVYQDYNVNKQTFTFDPSV